MRVITFEKACMLSLLCDELLARVPAIRPVNGMSVFTLCGDEHATTIQVPDDLNADDVASIEQVVMRHHYDTARKEEALRRIRVKRNRLLHESDWTQLPDAPLDQAAKEAWRTYRQELRDFPAVCDPFNPMWPEPPGA